MAITFSNMQHQSSSLRFIISSLFIILTIKLSEAYDLKFGTELQLIHRDHLLGRHHLNRSERILQMFYRDTIRIESIRRMSHDHHPEVEGHTIGQRRLMHQRTPVAVIPIRSGSGDGVGEYFAKLMVGTKPMEFLFVVDTGSDLTWVGCKFKSTRSRKKVVFDADSSMSFQTISCSSSYCRDDLLNLFSIPCGRGNIPCAYNYRYNGNAYAAQGIFAYETITFNLANGQQAKLNSTLIGCTTSSQGLESITAGANGILGLGNSKFSLPMQASKLFENKFSYCLVDIFSNKSIFSKLFLGPAPTKPKDISRMQSTKLAQGVAPLYGVYVHNIFVGGKKLDIPQLTIIDSGTTFMYLTEKAYGPVMDVLTKPLGKFKRARGPAGSPFQYCYASDLTIEKSALAMEIGFSGGAMLEVPPSSYLFPVPGDTGLDLRCLGIVNAGNGTSFIGNLVQQGHLWEFDVGNGNLNFGSSNCAY